MHLISSKEALATLRHGLPIRSARIPDLLDLRPLCTPGSDSILTPIQFIDCDLHRPEAAAVEFHAPVLLQHTTCRAGALFWAAYFLQGLKVQACRFADATDFQCGGHNRDGATIEFADTTFDAFANFFDCRFEGPVTFRRGTFHTGTNLLGNVGKPHEVRFDVPPIIDQVTGTLNLSGG
jgi:hypothetical protein